MNLDIEEDITVHGVPMTFTWRFIITQSGPVTVKRFVKHNEGNSMHKSMFKAKSKTIKVPFERVPDFVLRKAREQLTDVSDDVLITLKEAESG